jgi:hypothetical protein
MERERERAIEIEISRESYGDRLFHILSDGREAAWRKGNTMRAEGGETKPKHERRSKRGRGEAASGKRRRSGPHLPPRRRRRRAADLGVGALDVLREAAAGAAARPADRVAEGAVKLGLVVARSVVVCELLLQVRESWPRGAAGGGGGLRAARRRAAPSATGFGCVRSARAVLGVFEGWLRQSRIGIGES